MQTVSYTFLPSGFAPAAGAAAAVVVGAPAAGAGAAAVVGVGCGVPAITAPVPTFIMYSMARFTSLSESSAMPPRAGMPAWPFNADWYTLAKPRLARSRHAA